MKLKNKLLPLVGIGAVAATVAPITLTSCSHDKNMTNLLEYKTKFTALQAKPMYEKDAAKVYFGADNAVELIKDDILTMLSNETLLVQYVEEYIGYLLGIEADFKMQSAQADFHDLKVVEYKDGNNTAKLSGTIHLKLVTKVYEENSVGVEDKYIGLYTLETKHTLTKVPYTLWFSSESSLDPDHLSTGIADANLKANNDWMITRAYSGQLVYNKDSEPTEVENKSQNWYQEVYKALDADGLKEFNTMKGFIQWESSYLYNITKKA